MCQGLDFVLDFVSVLEIGLNLIQIKIEFRVSYNTLYVRDELQVSQVEFEILNGQ